MSWRNASCLTVLLSLSALTWAGDTVLTMPDGRLYVSECGSCHTAYAPALLPAPSWRKLMGELGRHFGDDASLGPRETETLLRQLETLAESARRDHPQVAQRNAGLPASELRISASPYFRYMHDEVPGSIWQRPKVGSKANCIACHPRANEGRYPEREIQIPK